MKKGFRILKFKKDRQIFEVRDVTKSFDGRPILKKLSLKVYPGECVGILGPNGCGKTTLFSMCIGEQNVDSGKIYLNNKSIEQIPIHLRSNEGLGYLPQQRSVFDMSVYDNIMGIAQLSIKGVENQKAITEQILNQFNLQHLRTINANALSGGEAKRMMISRLMINKPKIILLDEPYANLDPQIVQDIQKYIFKIQSMKVSVVITDHNLKNLFDTTDSNYVISDGSIIAEGTSQELLKNSRAVSQYFGQGFDL
jgi:lipopolysaccharide export system ATP-binding protein